MPHLPLLTDAYDAALFGGTESLPVVVAPRPEPATRPSGCEDEPGEDDDYANGFLEDSADDMETARTRPLRLDQIHL